jgi:hypothetical protein
MPADIVDFNAYPQPQWNDPDTVSVALAHGINAHNEESSWAAYDRLLYAVGNNHAGTYFPVVLAVFPSLEVILRDGTPWPRHTVLQVLIDLFSSFQPDPGHDVSQEASLLAAVRHRIVSLKPYLASLTVDNGITNKSAQELLNCLDE